MNIVEILVCAQLLHDSPVRRPLGKGLRVGKRESKGIPAVKKG